MSHETNDPELKALESFLAELKPSGGQLDGYRLIFEAGRASAQRHRFFWPALSGILAAALAGLGIAAAARPAPAPEIRIVYLPSDHPTASPRSDTPAPLPQTLGPGDRSPSTQVADERNPVPGSYLKLEKEVVDWGLDVLPVTSFPAEKAQPPLTIDFLLGAPDAAESRPEPPPLKRILSFGDRS